MSQQAPVVVILDGDGYIKDITVGGQTIAFAVRGTEMTARARHQGEITTIAVIMDVDKIITEGAPPAEWKPEDGQVGEWIRRNPEWFRDWAERYNRIAAMPLPIRRQDPT